MEIYHSPDLLFFPFCFVCVFSHKNGEKRKENCSFWWPHNTFHDSFSFIFLFCFPLFFFVLFRLNIDISTWWWWWNTCPKMVYLFILHLCLCVWQILCYMLMNERTNENLPINHSFIHSFIMFWSITLIFTFMSISTLVMPCLSIYLSIWL